MLQGPERTWFTFCPTPQVPPVLLSLSFYSSLLHSHQSTSPFAGCRFPAVRGRDGSLGKLLCGEVIFNCTQISNTAAKSDRIFRVQDKRKTDPVLGLSGDTVDPNKQDLAHVPLSPAPGQTKYLL